MGALFLIFFAFLNYVLSKVFRDKSGNVSTMTVGIISFCISVLIIYFGKDFVFEIVNGLRLSDTILYVLSGVGALILLYLFRKRLRFCMILMVAGLGLILFGALSNWANEWFVILVGALMFIIGIALCVKKKPKSPRYSQKEYHGDYHKYKYKTKELRAKQEYEYHQRLEGRRKVQKRDLEREQRRQTAKEKKLKERYARRFGKRTARKRFG